MMPTIAIGADHAGFEFKEVLKKWLEKNAYLRSRGPWLVEDLSALIAVA